MYVTQITAENLESLYLPCDQLDEARKALAANPAEIIEVARIEWMHASCGVDVKLMHFRALGRGAAANGGDSLWFDADTIEDLYDAAQAAFAPLVEEGV
jgi:hypothetical protein